MRRGKISMPTLINPPARPSLTTRISTFTVSENSFRTVFGNEIPSRKSDPVSTKTLCAVCGRELTEANIAPGFGLHCQRCVAEGLW